MPGKESPAEMVWGSETRCSVLSRAPRVLREHRSSSDACCCRRFYLCQDRLKCILLLCEPVGGCAQCNSPVGCQNSSQG